MARAKKQEKVSETAQPPRLGAHSNLFRASPEDVANMFLNYGLESIQILPNFPNIRFDDAASVTTQACVQVGKPFQDANLVIAGVSAHANWLDPDRARRKQFVKRFDAIIEHCQDFGASRVVTESGTLHPSHPWEDYADNHKPEALDLFIKNLAPSVKLAQKGGVTILIEGYLYHVIDSIPSALRVREEFGETVGFVMDPANFFSRGMISQPKKQLTELFKNLGPFAPIAHGKDVRYVQGELTTPRAGTGSLDYKLFLELLDQYQPECPLIFEQIRPEELRETIDFISRFYA